MKGHRLETFSRSLLKIRLLEEGLPPWSSRSKHLLWPTLIEEVASKQNKTRSFKMFKAFPKSKHLKTFWKNLGQAKLLMRKAKNPYRLARTISCRFVSLVFFGTHSRSRVLNPAKSHSPLPSTAADALKPFRDSIWVVCLHSFDWISLWFGYLCEENPSNSERKIFLKLFESDKVKSGIRETSSTSRVGKWESLRNIRKNTQRVLRVHQVQMLGQAYR